MTLKTVVSIFCVLLFGSFAMLSSALIYTTDLLAYESKELIKASDSIRAAKALKYNLLAQNRNWYLNKIGGHSKQGKHIPGREIIDINQLLTEAEQYVNMNDPEERAAFMALSQNVSSCLNVRNSLDKQSISYDEKYEQLCETADEAIASASKLVEIKQSQMRELIKNVDKLNQNANRVSAILLIIGILLLISIFIGIFTFIAVPLTAIAKTISQFSAGDSTVRMSVAGLKEVRDIVSNFNFMAQSLEEKRQSQLRFIASIAHDLRNPLSSILMASERLKSGGDETDQPLAGIIYRQTRSLDRLVGDLLDTTRIEAGQLNLDFSNKDICSLIKDSIDLHKVGSVLHTFKIDLPNESLVCKCDGERLLQVMNNLLSNAIKYSPNGGAIIVKGWREGNEIHITVSDHGIGIDPEDMKNIFKPFHRTKATKDTIAGIGLGLSVSKRIIEAHGGKLWASSVLGKGTTMHISLLA